MKTSSEDDHPLPSHPVPSHPASPSLSSSSRARSRSMSIHFGHNNNNESARHLLKAKEPQWSICTKYKLSKKSTVEACGKFLLFIGMMIYIFYQLAKYFDKDINRKDYIDASIVEDIPLAFIYIDWGLSNRTDCEISFGYYNGTVWNTTDYYEWFNWTDVSGRSDGDALIEDVFAAVDANGEAQYIKKVFIDPWGYEFHQYLFIPSDKDSIMVDSKDYHYALFECSDENSIPYDEQLWYFAGNREFLYDYETIDEAFRDFYDLSEYVDIGYDIVYTYNWYSFNNKVEKRVFHDYFAMSVDGTFLHNYHEDDNSVLNDDIVATQFRLGPNNVGIKNTFVTDELLDLWDIFGLAGGMFSTANQLLSYATFLFVWGIGFGSICQCKGIADESGPSLRLRVQMEGFMRTRDAKMLELNETIETMHQKIEQLELTIDNLNNNNNNNMNNNSGNYKKTNRPQTRLYNQISSISGETSNKNGNETESDNCNIQNQSTS